MKKLLSLLLMLVLLMALAPGALADGEEPANDVSKAESVDKVLAKHIPHAGDGRGSAGGFEHSPGGGVLFRVNASADFQPVAGNAICSPDIFTVSFGSGYIISKCYWKAFTMNSNRIWGWWAVDHATFQMDTEYALYFEFFVDCTYEELKSLQKNHVLYINGTSFDLETDQQLWDNEANGARIFVLAKLGKAPYLVIDTAAVTGLDTPKPGSIPSQTVTIPSGSHYTFKSAQWWVQYNEKSYLLSSDSKFEFGKTYLCYIVLDAEKG